MDNKSAPVVTVKEKSKEIYPENIKNYLETLDMKIQKMREIKFRAWHRGQAKMYPVKTMDFIDKVNDKLLLKTETQIGYIIANLRQCEIMQFTGLTDKNGKEIYEGDIVHVDSRGNPWVIEYGSFGDAAYYACNQINSCRQLDSGQYSAEFTIVDEPVECEIIGNIYESPELLE